MITGTPVFWEVFKAIEGALSCTESIAIMNISALAPKNDKYFALECGVHRGKSAMSAATQLQVRWFTLCDIAFLNEEIAEKVSDDVLDFSNVEILISDYDSVKEIATKGNYSYVFIDTGSHSDGLPMQEVKLLEDRMVEGGIIAFHDYKNQFTEVELAYDYLVSTGKYEPIPINWKEIFDYIAENNLEEGNNSWHLYPELGHPPNFVGAVKRK